MRKPCSDSLIIIFFLILYAAGVKAQQLKLGNNPTFIYPSAVLQLDSRNQGLLLTRVQDTSLISSLTPPDGTIIYFTDSQSVAQPYGPNAGVYQRKNGGWIPLWGVGYGNNGQVLRALGTNVFPMWENLLLDSLYNVKITSPQNGDVLIYNGSNWVNSSGNGTFWALNGNSVSTGNFLGTTNAQPLIFKANGSRVGYLGYGSPGGDNNVILGNGSSFTVGSTYAVVIGNAAGAQYGVAIGDGAQATAVPSTSVGYFSKATANSSLALGNQSTAAGSNSIALGNGAQATQQNSTAIGNGAIANVANTLILGNGAQVGIGTSAPANTLTVNSGTANASGITTTQMTSATPVASTDSMAGVIGVNASGKIVRTVGVYRSYNYPTSAQRPFNTVINPLSVAGDTYVTYSLQLATGVFAIPANATLQISPTGTGSWQIISQVAISGTLDLSPTEILSGWIPAGYYVQIVISGNVTYVSGQEVTMQ